MWIETLSHWVVVAALLAQTPAGSTSAAPALPESIVTRHPVFAIPFRVAPSADSAKQVVEVQLHVSTDRGAHWQQYAKAPTTQQQFLFHSEGDGEYWFVIRTLDRSGQVRPETIATPGLRVVVDSRPPTLTLTTQRQQPGQMTVRWETDELHPKPNTLAIQYRALPNGPWQPLAIHPQDADKPTGEVVLRLKPGENDIQLRGEVADTAGNIGFGHAQSRPGDVNSRPTGIADAQTPARTLRPLQPTGADATAAAEPKGSVAININPAIGNRFASPEESSNQRLAIPGLPAGERPRMVNSRLFELEYDVDSVGPSGVGRVELWGTRDGGKTWRSFATDQSHRSPLLVNVDEEGIYGFRLVVSNGAGLGAKPPKSGDLPDIWIGVDLTKPTARIVSAQQGTDSEAGRLIIAWQADDNIMLAARPVSLSFSQAPGGPWLSIATGLENTGRYAWPIDNRTPQQLYLRLEVRDEAGNTAAYEAAEPVTIDQSQPSVRIRDVRPRS